MEDQLEDVMERIRARQNEMSDVKENEVKKVITKQESLPPPSPTKVFGNSSRSNETVPPKTSSITQASEPPNPAVNNDSTVNESNTTKKSRFSMLSANIDEYEVFDANNPFNKPKEAYMKGRSPRLSVGETRSSVLFTPAGQASLRNQNVAKTPPHSTSGSGESKSAPNVITQSEFEARRIKFAQPIVNTHYLPNDSSVFSGSSVNDMSTVLGGSAEMMNVTTSSLSCTEMSMNQQITNENTVINAQSCDNREAILRDRNVSSDEYGAHTFMRKKVPKQQEAIAEEQDPIRTPVTKLLTRPNYHALVSSPKPFSKEVGKSAFSPVHFTPKSTSSPKMKLVESAAGLSPSKTAALQGSVAKTRMMQFEQQLQKTNAHAPMPSAPIVPVPTPRHHIEMQPKKDLFAQKSTPHVQPEPAVKPIPSGVQTQWRGQANTPVVQGARAEDKTAGVDVVGAGVGRLKNLKSRWEFCSATGTPIHPDATEDSLIATAIKMKETAIPTKIGHRIISGRKGPSTSSIHSQPIRSATASPSMKSPTFGYESEVFDDDEHPEKSDEKPVIDSDESIHEEIPEGDTSRFIDHAFGFIEGGTTPSPYRPLDGHVAPLAKFDESGTPKRFGRKDIDSQIIEEEDVPGGDTDEEEEEVTERGDEQPTFLEPVRIIEQPSQQKERSSNDSSLPYSVSFYRKKQRERVGESCAPLTPIVPSAPTLSLTSPQKLKQLTSGHYSGGDYASSPTGGRIMESQQHALDRLRRAKFVEEKHVQQSQQAMDLSRRDPNFRGSRHEFEAQRAHLAHVEKYRALIDELKRLERDGPRIVDGPRGSLSVTSLAVRMAPEFAAYYSESNKSEEIFYFVAVLRYGEQVTVSQIVTSDDANNRRRALEFPSLPLQLTAIPPDFQATLEIYGQRAMREVKPKGATLKAKNVDEWCFYVERRECERRLADADAVKKWPCRLWKKLHSNRNPFGSSSSANQSAVNYTTSSSSTNFNLLGSFTFDINAPYKKDYKLSHYVHPLTGEVQMKIRKQTVDGADISHRGFMSMYQRDGKGVGSWTRYWCVLDNGELKFWKQPEDEGSKSWLVLLDLSTCCRSEGASPVNDICPFPNSFHIDVWVPRDDGAGSDATIGSRNDIEKLRVMLAADTNDDMSKWLSAINSTSKQLCTWRNPIH